MKKNKHICIRVNQRQRNYIENQAKKLNKSITDYMIISAMDKTILQLEDLIEVRIELNRIGNNINQITKKVNQGAISAVNFRETKLELQKIWQLLNLLIKKVNILAQ